MTEYIRAKHPNPEKEYNDEIPNEQLPGCGKSVLLEYNDAPPVEAGDIFRDICPYCEKSRARLEVLEIPQSD